MTFSFVSLTLIVSSVYCFLGSHYVDSGMSMRQGKQGYEEGFLNPMCVATLGISDEDLILMPTRDLNKFLKVKVTFLLLHLN